MFAAFALVSGSEGLCECSLRGLEDSTCRSGKGGVGDLVAESAAQGDLSARLDIVESRGSWRTDAEGCLLGAEDVQAMSDEWTWTGEERDRCMGNMVSAWSDCPRHCQRNSAGSEDLED